MDVYADILFLVNGGMDALCLALTAGLIHRPLTWRRMVAAAMLGGVYGVAVLFLEMGTVLSLMTDVAVCLLLCGIAFGRRKLWLTGGVYLLCSMALGGIMTALYHWLNRAGMAALLPRGEEGVSSVAFALLAAVSGLFTLLWGRIFRKSEGRRAAALSVKVTLGGETVTLKGMVDSGNLLTDPISGIPVIAVKRENLLPLLSKEARELLTASASDAEALTRLPEGARIRLIPTATATGQGMLISLRPDGVSLEVEGKKPYEVRTLVCAIPMEAEGAEALVPASLLL